MKKIYSLLFVLLAMVFTLAAQKNILYVGATAPGEELPSDSITMLYLEDAGYTVTYVDDDDVKTTYDYSGYDAVVYGESCSSSKVVNFGTFDLYPAACVMLEPLAVRDDKWGWVTDRENHFQENRDGLTGWDKLQIKDTTHYITAEFLKDQVFQWSSRTATGDPQLYAHGFAVDTYITGALPLAQNMSSAITFPCLWALDKGTVINDTVTLGHRLVVWGTHAIAIADDDDESASFGDVYGTALYFNLVVRAVDWVIAGEKEGSILYVGATAPAEILPSDSSLMAMLKEAGYGIWYVDDDDVKVTYDYSPFPAVVYGESVSSSKVVNFGTFDLYPAPCVMLEPLAVRDDKWGWVTDRENHFQENREGLTGWDKIQILDNTHYITSVFTEDEAVLWSTAPYNFDNYQVYAHGFAVNNYITGAMALGQNMSSGVTFPCLWALEKGTVINDTVTLTHRLVVWGTHAKGMADDDDDSPAFGTIYKTAGVDTFVVRSLRWVLGAGPGVGINTPEKQSFSVNYYPNPAYDYVNLEFTLERPVPVSVRIVNIIGQTIKNIQVQNVTRGLNHIEISTRDLSSGLYLFVLDAGTRSCTGKIRVTK